MASSKAAALSGLLVSKRSAEPPPRPEHPGLEQAQTPAIHAVATSQPDSVPGSLPSPMPSPVPGPVQPEERDPGTDREAGPGGREQSPYYKALTLKVDRARFTKLKTLGVQRDLRSQALLTEALDLLFAQHGM